MASRQGGGVDENCSRFSKLGLAAGRFCALFVTLVGLLTLTEYLFGLNLGIDQLIFKDTVGAIKTTFPGRMAPNSAFNFLLVGLALILLDVKTRARTKHPSQLLALIANFVALLPLVGYLYEVTGLQGFFNLTPMAMHTALTFFLLSLGILLAHPDMGLMALVTDNDHAGYLTRRLLPAAVLIPILLGWLRYVGERKGLYGEAFGISLMIIGSIVIFVALIFFTAGSLHRSDTERRLTGELLRKSEERIRLLLNSTAEAIYGIDLNGNCSFANSSCVRILGYNNPSELIGLNMHKLIHHKRADGTPYPIEECRIYQAFRKGENSHLVDEALWRSDGTSFPVEYWSFPLYEKGQIAGSVVTFLDITERKRAQEILRNAHAELEQLVNERTQELKSAYESLSNEMHQSRQLQEQLLRAQKMEAIGRLAGGIAHEFKNLLTVITGYAELRLPSLPPQDSIRGDLEEILKAGRRATDLTGQLLAFSRRQIINPVILNLNEVISGMEKMLRHLLGEQIELVLKLETNLAQAKADPGQIEQVIANLAINSRDAMPEGGKLIITTENVVLDETYTRDHSDMSPGEHVVLAVSDTGHGMTEEIKAHLFEPFFTTKEKGKGTGLGLATSYGIIKQMGGGIWVYSEPDRGTTFKIYLPSVKGAAETVLKPAYETQILRGKETILVVEDEVSVRNLAVRILRELGYAVVEAENGIEALRFFEKKNVNGFDLVFTDIIMPVMGGQALAVRLKALQPDLKILFTSGYADALIAHHDLLTEAAAFIEKPYSPMSLSQKVRNVLDGNA